ncbi:hypothetical protein NPIL_368201 [Nephila pilipes]|uniref:Uncharacterized protein n=1 Tax=Nephila pilipes TaxID=299642 RepID=A0A8X6UT34_NEPPI|nr:hypothetical protein NPIL_368201 [Nephila pilipes]
MVKYLSHGSKNTCTPYTYWFVQHCSWLLHTGAIGIQYSAIGIQYGYWEPFFSTMAETGFTWRLYERESVSSFPISVPSWPQVSVAAPVPCRGFSGLTPALLSFDPGDRVLTHESLVTSLPLGECGPAQLFSILYYCFQ